MANVSIQINVETRQDMEYDFYARGQWQKFLHKYNAPLEWKKRGADYSCMYDYGYDHPCGFKIKEPVVVYFLNNEPVDFEVYTGDKPNFLKK
jgi:hypothetical protein